MSEFRKMLLNRIIALYGENSSVALNFSNLCKYYSPSAWNDRCLQILVEAHEGSKNA